MAGLTTAFLQGIDQNPDVPDQVVASAQVELVGGIPFMSDADAEEALQEAGLPDSQVEAIVDENETARITALRVSLAALALIALVSLFFTRLVPTVPVGGVRAPEPG